MVGGYGCDMFGVSWLVVCRLWCCCVDFVDFRFGGFAYDVLVL